MKIRVYYEDTDAGGVVYHTNYIKYCERARSEIFFQKGLSPAIDNCHFVVSSLDCRFIKPAKLGNILDIKTATKEIKATTVILHQAIYLNDKMIFEMEVKLGFVDSSGKIRKIPSELKSIFS